MQLTVTNMPPGDSTGPTSISVFTKWRAPHTNTTAVRPTSEVSAGHSLRNKFRQKLTVANVAAAAYGRTQSSPGISK